MAESKERSYKKFVGVVADVLDSLGLEYAIAGSFASSQYGEPRATLDVDLTLHIESHDADRLATAFDAVDMMADAHTIFETYEQSSLHPFAVIDLAGAWKADCFLLQSTAYARTAFDRRREFPYPETRRKSIWLYAPEDVILSKLEYYKMSQGVSTKHLRDIAGMITNLKAKNESLDTAYVSHWATKLQVNDYWSKLWDDFQQTGSAQ